MGMGKPIADRFIDEAFRAILSNNIEVARRALARAQAEHYGQKPWLYGFPEHDALGNTMVYLDPDGQGRYSVHAIQDDGAHVRVHFGPYDYGAIRSFEARGPTAEQAKVAAEQYVKQANLGAFRNTSSFALGDGVCIKFSCGRAPLD